MDRKAFLLEMKKGFWQTVKEVSSPFVEEKLEGVDAAIENITGVHWKKVENIFLPLKENCVRDITVARLPLMLAQFDGKRICVHKKCKKCGAFLNYLSYQREIKCLSCELSFSLTEEGGGQLELFHTKIEDGCLWVAIPLRYLH